MYPLRIAKDGQEEVLPARPLLRGTYFFIFVAMVTPPMAMRSRPLSWKTRVRSLSSPRTSRTAARMPSAMALTFSSLMGPGLDVGHHHLLGGGLAVFVEGLILVDEGVDVGGLQNGGGGVIELGHQGVFGLLFQTGNVDIHTGHGNVSSLYWAAGPPYKTPDGGLLGC